MRELTFLWVAAAALTLLTACGKAPPPEEPVRSVKLVTVSASGLGSTHEYAADVRARIESRLGFRVAGKITRRAVEAGQRVRKGDLLAQLDPSDYQLAAQAARAQVSAATTQRDLASADLKRYQGLRDQGFVSAAEIERRTAQLQSAQAQLAQAQAQLSNQGNQAAYTQLLADADGVVTAIDNHQLARIARIAGAPKVQGAGVDLMRKLGDAVERGGELYRVHADYAADLEFARQACMRASAYSIGSADEVPRLFVEF